MTTREGAGERRAKKIIDERRKKKRILGLVLKVEYVSTKYQVPGMCQPFCGSWATAYS